MAETGITSAGLIRDWYDRFVKPKQGYGDLGVPTTFPTAPKPIPALSRPGPLSTGTPAPAAPAINFGLPPLEAGPVADPGAGMEVAPPTAPGSSILNSIKSGASAIGEGIGNMSQPAKMGLLGMGLSMMATPPRSTPYSGAEILGRSGIAGIGFYEKALEDKRKDEALTVASEDRKLALADRHQANLDRTEYYKERNELTKAENASKDLARKALDADRADNSKTIDPALATAYKLDPKMTIGEFKAQKEGIVGMSKPGKSDPYSDYVASKGGKLTAAEIKEWHRTQGSAGGAGGPGKSAAISHVNNEISGLYLADAKEYQASLGSDGMKEVAAMTALFSSGDEFSRGANKGRVRQSLPAEKRKEFDWVTQRAQRYSTTMVPAEAVATAKAEWDQKHPAAAPKERPPLKAGETRKDIGGKSYIKKIDPADGKMKVFLED